ncbi:energy transducer TonB [Parasphingorhabdus sp.]|uniref:energy transducer TonB n=1 Tax=Parasphingorhabdus sp. TaxID=2709688 RepID=UPI00326346C9
MKYMRLLDIGREAAVPAASFASDRSEAIESSTNHERGQYSSTSPANRSVALTLTLAFHALFLGGFLIQWGVTYVKRETPSLAVFNVAPPAAPSEPITEVPPGPKQVEKETPKPEPVERDIEPPEIQLVSDNPVAMRQRIPDPGPPVEKTTAPETSPLPPASQHSNVEASWEAQLLAHLERFRRYPASAKARREQGIAYIRFTMDKQGQLISAQLARSSGSRRLDKAALATIKRAAPFPKPPQDLPGISLELTVPIEFFMR